MQISTKATRVLPATKVLTNYFHENIGSFGLQNLGDFVSLFGVVQRASVSIYSLAFWLRSGTSRSKFLDQKFSPTKSDTVFQHITNICIHHQHTYSTSRNPVPHCVSSFTRQTFRLRITFTFVGYDASNLKISYFLTNNYREFWVIRIWVISLDLSSAPKIKRFYL